MTQRSVVPIFVLASVLFVASISSAQATTMFAGLPGIKISEGGGERLRENLSRDRAVNLACVTSLWMCLSCHPNEKQTKKPHAMALHVVVTAKEIADLIRKRQLNAAGRIWRFMRLRPALMGFFGESLEDKEFYIVYRVVTGAV